MQPFDFEIKTKRSQNKLLLKCNWWCSFVLSKPVGSYYGQMLFGFLDEERASDDGTSASKFDFKLSDVHL